jgi:hypothetical protein
MKQIPGLLFVPKELRTIGKPIVRIGEGVEAVIEPQLASTAGVGADVGGRARTSHDVLAVIASDVATAEFGTIAAWETEIAMTDAAGRVGTGMTAVPAQGLAPDLETDGEVTGLAAGTGGIVIAMWIETEIGTVNVGTWLP